MSEHRKRQILPAALEDSLGFRRLPWSGVVPGKDYHIEKVVDSDVA
jgi:hypothetical protein